MVGFRAHNTTDASPTSDVPVLSHSTPARAAASHCMAISAPVSKVSPGDLVRVAQSFIVRGAVSWLSAAS